MPLKSELEESIRHLQGEQSEMQDAVRNISGQSNKNLEIISTLNADVAELKNKLTYLEALVKQYIETKNFNAPGANTYR